MVAACRATLERRRPLARCLDHRGHPMGVEPHRGSPGADLPVPARVLAATDAYHAGFGEVRTEDVPVTFQLPGIDEYIGFISDAAGPLAMVLRGLSAAEREAFKAQTEATLERFAGEDGYRIPGVALCAAAS